MLKAVTYMILMQSYWILAPNRLLHAIVHSRQDDLSAYLVLVKHQNLEFQPCAPVVLQTWLQEFSWCEEKLEKKKDEMDKLMCSRSHHMFCFESAMKLYYWSELVYDYREVGDLIGFHVSIRHLFILSGISLHVQWLNCLL